jgi:hypothetical protein
LDLHKFKGKVIKIERSAKTKGLKI